MSSATRQSVTAFGGRVIRAGPKIMHGKTSRIHHDNKTIFKELPQDFAANALSFSGSLKKKTLSGRSRNFGEDRMASSWVCVTAKLLIEGVQFPPRIGSHRCLECSCCRIFLR